jgi:hypothetical protein
MRVIKSNKACFVGVKKFPKNVPVSIANEYTSIVMDNLEACKKLASTLEGPGIDSKRSHSSHKTYNNDCLKELFQTPLSKELWQAYIKVIFSDSDPNSLIYRFEFTCCKCTSHTQACRQKWEELRQVLVDYLGSMEVRI